MADGNGHNEAVRPDVKIQITWNPNTGKVDLASENGNPMEVLGVLELAAHLRRVQTCAPPAPGRVIGVAGAMFPQLRG